jgi:hypothetical protein
MTLAPLHLAVLLAVPAIAQSAVQVPDLVGTWTGVEQYNGQDMNFTLVVGRDAAGVLSAELVHEGFGGRQKVQNIRLEQKSVVIEADAQTIMKGELAADGSQFRGITTYKNAPGFEIRFVLKRKMDPLAQSEFPFKDLYTKKEVRIPMRDGVELFVALYLPKDITKPHPILLQRTPYSVSPYGEADFTTLYGLGENYAKDGYIFAFQDVRGRFQSKGHFEHVRPVRKNLETARQVDETTDTYDTIEWLVKNVSGANGRVGLKGLSYPGFYAAVGAVRAHPALKAVSPQAPIMDWFIGDDDHRNGALCLDMFEFVAGMFGPETNYPATSMVKPFDFGTPDGYRFYRELGPVKNLEAKYGRGQWSHLKDLLAHPNYDAFWQARNLRPHLKDIHPAVLTVGGWFDGEDMFGALECFKSIGRQSPTTTNHLVMGPWSHGQWTDGAGESLGQGEWGQATAQFYRDRIEKPFFDHYLLDKGNPDLPKAYLFEVGSNRWRKFDTWPSPQAKTTSFFFEGDGRLGKQSPSRSVSFDEFVSDPAKPVPYKAGISTYHTEDYLVEDQRFASTRPDVMVYESDPLKEDLTIAGPIRADLWVSTSGTDADWVVKVIDVHPGNEPDPLPNPKGYRNGHWQQLVRADVMRGKFRNSFEKPAPFVPNHPTRVAWTLNDVLHTFRKGHRVMVQVQCSWFPLVDRNPQVFTDINNADAKDFHKATQRIYNDAKHPSRIEVGVLPAE